MVLFKDKGDEGTEEMGQRESWRDGEIGGDMTRPGWRGTNNFIGGEPYAMPEEFRGSARQSELLSEMQHFCGMSEFGVGDVGEVF